MLIGSVWHLILDGGLDNEIFIQLAADVLRTPV